jgi:hypothetical protein
MQTETPPASPSRRPRTSLLVLLGIVLAVAAVMTLRNSAGPAVTTSNPGRPPQQAAADKLDPAQLDVKLERLQETLPAPDDTERNPFRFRPKAPPPPPPGPRNGLGELKPVAPPPPPPPQGPPPIPLKFIGVTEAPGVGKIAALTDCRHTVQGMEGEIIEGRYRIVKIGLESLVIEYVDGKGRTTLRMSGQECVGK